MTQNILRKLMLIAVLLTGSHAFAHDFEAQNSDGVTIYYNILSKSDRTVAVAPRYYNGIGSYYGRVVVPQKVVYNSTTYSVTSIGNYAFSDCTSLTSVTIPNSVTSIGFIAFENCSSLTSVTIPNSVTSIGYYAFRNCSSLTSVTIPNSVTSIGESAFYGCSGLTSVTIGNSVTSIGSRAFSYCSVLTSIVVENGNTVYDSRDNCNAIIETATNTLISGCKTTVIPSSVTSIGESAFYGCSGLTSVTIGNSVTSIGEVAFSDCSSLTSVTIGNSVTSIGHNAFSYCSVLTSVTIPNSVTSIGHNAFRNCSSLTSVTIGNSVTSIGNYAFSDCTSLTEVYCKATNPPTCREYNTIFEDKTIQYATLYVPTGCKSAYESVDPWRNFWNIVGKDMSNVESTLADNTVNVSVENGNIVIAGAENVKVEVYGINGQLIYGGNATTIPVTAKGMYIVKVNNKSFKVIL